MNLKILAMTGACLSSLTVASPVAAQAAGDGFVRIGASRTKLADKGEIKLNGAVVPGADYETRDTFHATLSGGYYVANGIALEASISSPMTTGNLPTGSIAGPPNLGDDEFVLATIGASFHPIKGPISPYVGGGYIHHFTTQERDGFAVGLKIPNAGGPYVQAGVDVAVSERWGLYAEARKGFYHTNTTARLPLDATFTTFADTDAKAVLDPLTIQIGLTAHLSGGRHAAPAQDSVASDETKWVVRPGLTSLNLADRAKLMVAGAPYPGAGISTREHHTLTLQIGRYLTQNIAINFTGGIPPTVDVYGAGSIGALPKLGSVTYGPTALTLQYHFTRSGVVRPYVGVGASYMIVFGTKDGAFRNLKVDNDLGPAFEAGADFMVKSNFGLFADVKHAYLRPKAYGSFSGLPVVAPTKLDPWAFTGGVAFHF